MQGATKKSRRKVAAFLLPFALLLTACESHNNVAVHEDGSMEIALHFKDDSGMFAQQFKCQDLEKEMDITTIDKVLTDIQMTDNSSGNTLDCTMTIKSKGSAVNGDTLIETPDSYILNFGTDGETEFKEQDLEMFKQFNVQFSFNVKMPGEIVKADGATVNGNTATYNDIKILSKKITVEGKKSAKGSVATTKDDKKDDSKKDAKKSSEAKKDSGSDEAKESESSILPWALGGLVVLGLIGVGIFFLVRKKSNDNPAQGYGFDGQSPYGQNPYGQQPTPGAPYQYNPQGAPQQSSGSPFSYAEAPAPVQPMPGQPPVPPAPPVPPIAQQPGEPVPPVAPAEPTLPVPPAADAPLASETAPGTAPAPSTDGTEDDTPDYNNWRKQ
ncbi:hypothetical protein JOD55_000053 [Arcanobacterium pluranimalium]|uniref:hypothetical protein n=1 Tax=Arcanobacterium pluranimalium TaxID=108028 RepID=UPI00195B9360|nr:hypothetical protein [Arcanobacterium pluranimalium]MBM7824226.1 hypothetical protein [Arcanobacterium pluranimalium]